ncbi:MAG: hypothetical protein K8T25_22545 [Planctomycetia bacterium]|nr:hypothetical protein [Planctomycetia bacterium]
MPDRRSHTPAVEILDVTIRDGSYVVDFQFTDEDVRFLCGILERLGFRYIEVGHGFGLGASGVKGVSAAADHQYLAAAAASLNVARFGAFFIPGIGTREQLASARREYGMHFVRIGQDAQRAEECVPYIEYAKELGYEVMCNFMKSYTVPPATLGRAGALVAAHGCDAVYLVDSAGGMLPHEVAEYTRILAESCPARIGFHGHNNLELAGANALSAIEQGCTLVDCSIGGLGRSAGNTRTEMMIPALLRLGHEVEYDLVGVLEVLERFIQPILDCRALSPNSILSGMARLHSGATGDIDGAAARHGVPLRELLAEYARGVAHGGKVPTAEEAADRLAKRRASTPNTEFGTDNILLRAHGLGDDPNRIRNTFVAIDEVFGAVGVLAHKARRPVVLLVDIVPADADEAFDMADFLYQDEHFIVVGAVFGSLSRFALFATEHRGQIDVFVFDDALPHGRPQLHASRRRWHRGEKVVFLDRRSCHYHYLVAEVHNRAAQVGASRILLLGGDLAEFARHLPRTRRDYRYGCLLPELYRGGEVNLFDLDLAQGQALPEMSPSEQTFELLVLLALISVEEMERVLDRVDPQATVLDCIGHREIADLIRRRGRGNYVRLDPRRALSGELLNLLGSLPAKSRSDESAP